MKVTRLHTADKKNNELEGRGIEAQDRKEKKEKNIRELCNKFKWPDI